jgi:hypothetical protein
MKRVLVSGITCAVCAIALMAGCAKAPQKEAMAAKAALESAKAANAPIFAAEQFNAAQKMLYSAFDDIKAQNKKSLFSRNYEQSTKMLVDATAAARAARAAVAANKAKIVEEATMLLVKAKAAVKESSEMVEVLIKKKNSDAADLKKKLEDAAASLPADIEQIEEEALVTTRDDIKNAIASIETVKMSIEKLNAEKPVVKKKGRK